MFEKFGKRATEEATHAIAALPSPADSQAAEQQPAPAKPRIPFFGRSKAAAAADVASVGTSANTSRELSKLRRVDLLELLVDATRENERLSDALAYETDLAERLKVKLDEKDAQIEHLKARLDGKDARMSELEEQNTAIAHASCSVTADELLEVERVAIQEYLKQVAAQHAQNGGDPQGGALISLAVPTAPRDKHARSKSPMRKLFSSKKRAK